MLDPLPSARVFVASHSQHSATVALWLAAGAILYTTYLSFRCFGLTSFLIEVLVGGCIGVEGHRGFDFLHSLVLKIWNHEYADICDLLYLRVRESHILACLWPSSCFYVDVLPFADVHSCMLVAIILLLCGCPSFCSCSTSLSGFAFRAIILFCTLGGSLISLSKS
jgi:hypothetical protein